MRFSLIAACDQEMGIGKGGTLPWRLPKELEYFHKVTSEVKDLAKRNAVIMGRKTWESIPAKRRPLAGRLNFVLSRTGITDIPSLAGGELKSGLNAVQCASLDEALNELACRSDIENIFVIGGAQIFFEAIVLPECRNIYLTRIDTAFGCDTFFPPIPRGFEIDGQPMEGIENGLKYQFLLYKQRGKFVVIYGINNIGKSKQVGMLVERLGQVGIEARSVKYPLYDLQPTGQRLNSILREHAEPEIGEIALQLIYVQNRKDFEPFLRQWLEQGVWVVAEDYIGTGLAWGWTKGASLDSLEEMNRGLLQEDVAILLDGKRFVAGKEHNHIHERADDWVERCREKHLELAKKYGWRIVNANRSAEDVHEEVWGIVFQETRI